MLGLKINAYLIVGLVSILSILGIVIYNQHNISDRQEIFEKSIVGQKQLVEQIVRSQNEYATRKDIELFAKNNNINVKAIKKDLKTLDASLESVNNIKVVSKGTDITNIKSTTTGTTNPTPPPPKIECDDGVCDNPDKHGYLGLEQRLVLIEPFDNEIGVPLGEVGFSAWKEKPWSLKLHKREYSVTTVVGVDKERRQYYYNKFSVVVKGKSYDLPINVAKTKQIYPEARFRWWDPGLHMGVAGGTYLDRLSGEILVNVGASIMSYGRYSKNPELKILNVGLGYGTRSNNFHITVAPIYYNIGNHLPLINNTYIGPTISVNKSGDSTLLLGVSVGL